MTSEKPEPHDWATNLYRQLRHGAGGRILVVAYSIIAFATIIQPMIAGPREYPIDFYYFWAAGSLWADGASPYSPIFFSFFDTYPEIHSGSAIRPFFYPPNIIVLFAPLGIFGMYGAWSLMSLANLSALLLAGLLIAKLTRHIGLTKTLLYPTLLHFSIICLGWSIGKLFFIHAQPMPIIYAAFLSVVIGAIERRKIPIILGLTVCLMKPGLGLPIAFACLLTAHTRTPALLAGIITAILCAVGLASGGIITNSMQFLENLSLYSQYPENSAIQMSGFGLLVSYLLGSAPSVFIWLALCLFVVAAMRLHMAAALASTGREENDAAALIIFAAAAALLLIPGHNNYFLPATAVLVWVARDIRPDFFLALAGYFLICQAYGLTFVFAYDDSVHAVINLAVLCTVGAGFMFAVLCRRMVLDYSERGQPQGNPGWKKHAAAPDAS